MEKRIKQAFVLFATLLGVSCTDMFDTIQGYLDEGEQHYASKIDSLKALPGNDRVLIRGLLMYGNDTRECRIRWTPGDGEAVIPIEREPGVQPFEYSVEHLSDGYYTFEVVTFDAEGTSSLVQTVESRSYGPVYAATLRARGVEQSEQQDEQVLITLSGVLQDSYKSVLVYPDKSGTIQRRDLAVTDQRVTLDDWKSEGTYWVETYYLPAVNAVDTFMVKSEEYRFPKYENIAMVPKEGFVPLMLDNDLALNVYGGSLAHAFDGLVNNDNYAHSWGGWSSGPAWFTFDMGKLATLHSFRLNGISREDRAFTSGYMKQWEIWGRADAPSQDGSWDGWTKLLDCESVKPSGLPDGEFTDEDLARAAEGETFLFPEGLQPVRYVRIKVNDVWSETAGRFLVFTELTFWEFLPQ